MNEFIPSWTYHYDLEKNRKIINQFETTNFWNTNDSEDDSSETSISKFRFRTFDFEYVILSNRVSSQPCGVMFCGRRRSRSPRLCCRRRRCRAWRLTVWEVHFDIDGLEEDMAEVLPLAYGPSRESLREWLAWLHEDMYYTDPYPNARNW